ncbi:hypothetical protein WGT02_28495 (plasmid) [Rhizobium sp. T1470]|uniref:hypothetical protein n=1 Tax=unclassified Rhizobium TaxID=2613769 RepID=UPI001AAF6626|nr:hypothetical protein [Rhizobium sp. T1473]MCA0805144.1 hypothetical protein [Rhizobium sp. T1473]
MALRPKANTVGIPRVEALAGRTSFHLGDHDGNIIFGDGEFQFDTRWEYLESERVRVYNDGDNIVGVAVGSGDTSYDLKSLGPTDLGKLNFTSRTREARRGQLVVYENQDGHYLAVIVRNIRSVRDQERVATVEYVVVENNKRGDGLYSIDEPLPDIFFEDKDEDEDEEVLTTESGEAITDNHGNPLTVSVRRSEFSDWIDEAVFSPFEPDEIRGAAIRARLRLNALVTGYSERERRAGLGHNNPPPEFLILEDERQNLLTSLDMLVELHPGDRLDRLEAAPGIRDVLIKTAGQIARWTAGKLDAAAGGFADEIGKYAAKGAVVVAGWYILGGDLMRLAEMITKALG